MQNGFIHRVGPTFGLAFFRRIWRLVRSGASRAGRMGVRILGRVFLREEDPGWILPRDCPARSIRLFRVLGRRRRLEGTLAVDLGRLADAAGRQGLDRHARLFARGAFEHWRRARQAGDLLRRKAEEVLRRVSP